MIVASFPGAFGSSVAAQARQFCARHGIPLAWGFGGGLSWDDEELHKVEFIPFSNTTWPGYRPRLLDPLSGWNATNATSNVEDLTSGDVWATVEAEVAKARRLAATAKRAIAKEVWQTFWNRLVNIERPIRPLRDGDCASADLCIGTYPKGEARECVCRRPPATLEAPVAPAILV